MKSTKQGMSDEPSRSSSTASTSNANNEMVTDGIAPPSHRELLRNRLDLLHQQTTDSYATAQQLLPLFEQLQTENDELKAENARLTDYAKRIFALEAQLDALREENRKLLLGSSSMGNSLNSSTNSLYVSTNSPDPTSFEFYGSPKTSLDAIILHLERDDISELASDPISNRTALHLLARRPWEMKDVEKLTIIINLMFNKFNLSMETQSNKDNLTPILYAIRHKNKGLVHALLACSPAPDLRHRGIDGNNAIALACTTLSDRRKKEIFPSVTIIKELLEKTDLRSMFQTNAHGKNAKELITDLCKLHPDSYLEIYKMMLTQFPDITPDPVLLEAKSSVKDTPKRAPFSTGPFFPGMIATQKRARRTQEQEEAEASVAISASTNSLAVSMAAMSTMQEDDDDGYLETNGRSATSFSDTF